MRKEKVTSRALLMDATQATGGLLKQHTPIDGSVNSWSITVQNLIETYSVKKERWVEESINREV